MHDMCVHVCVWPAMHMHMALTLTTSRCLQVRGRNLQGRLRAVRPVSTPSCAKTTSWSSCRWLLWSCHAAGRRRDYRHVFSELLSCTPRRPRVQAAVVSDFEAAVSVWSAIKATLPGVVQRGCSFHSGQAVWRNIQAVGLQRQRMRQTTVCSVYAGRHWHWRHAVVQLQHEAREHILLTQHLAYVDHTWVQSCMWQPSAWSVYCTNNDVEGWHQRLNAEAHHGRLNLYQLIQLLHTMVNVDVKLLSEGKAARLQLQGRIQGVSRVSGHPPFWLRSPFWKLQCR